MVHFGEDFWIDKVPPVPKVVILCGGRGERLGEVSLETPKPMVEIGGKPIVYHVMHSFAQYGFKRFTLAVGYLGHLVDWYFRDSSNYPSDWVVTILPTGAQTQNGGRLKRIRSYLSNDLFFLAWCDGLSDIDFIKMLEFHKNHKKFCTVAAIHPPEQFGRLEITDDQVTAFYEKGQSEKWINGGFFLCEPPVFDYIEGDNSQWETTPMIRLADDRQLMAFRHSGFWQCMDTAKDHRYLEKLCQSCPPWIRQ